jgi:hypothetical protein
MLKHFTEKKLRRPSAAPTAGAISNNVPDVANILKPNTNYLSVFNSPQFTGALGLLDKLKAPNPTLNNRIALNTAAGDQTTEAIFRLLGDPQKAAQFAGRKVLFGVSTISINPGYRTRRDYAADLGVLPRFDYIPARMEVVKRFILDTNVPEDVRASVAFSYDLTNRSYMSKSTFKTLFPKHEKKKKQGTDGTVCHCPGMTGKQKQILKKWSYEISADLREDNVHAPLAMAVSPLADVDVADEGSSLRSQVDFALSLSGVLRKAGLQAQASAVEQFARRREQDSHTRTALTAINTYSAGGGLFGWQVGPRFRAMEDPGQKNHGSPANILDRQTFPALVLVGFNEDDVYPRLRIDCDYKVKVLEPTLVFRTTSRWLPLKNGWWQKRYSETEHLETSARARVAESRTEQFVKSFPATAALAKYRLQTLRFQAFGSDTTQTFAPKMIVPLPDSAKPASITIPSVTQISPATVELDSDTNGKPQLREQKFVILGENLKQVNLGDISALTGQIQLSTPVIANGAIVLSTSITNSDPILFSLPFNVGVTNNEKTAVAYVNPPKVTVSLRKAVTRTKDENAPSAVLKTIQKLPTTPAGSAEYTVEIGPKVTAEQIAAARSIIENEINKSKPVQLPSDPKK